MKKLILVFIAALGIILVPQTGIAQSNDVQPWEQQARNVTIIRDNWGIAHVYGKTDADAVFGMIYAQAEDDFNRVETNYINSMGRLAEAEVPGSRGYVAAPSRAAATCSSLRSSGIGKEPSAA